MKVFAKATLKVEQNNPLVFKRYTISSVIKPIFLYPKFSDVLISFTVCCLLKSQQLESANPLMPGGNKRSHVHKQTCSF